jgi:hypothetical protein
VTTTKPRELTLECSGIAWSGDRVYCEIYRADVPVDYEYTKDMIAPNKQIHVIEASALLAKDEELKALGEMYREQIQLHGKERSENARLRELLSECVTMLTILKDASACETSRENARDALEKLKALSGGEV